MFNVLYIHGMGGGADSRIPSILREYFSSSVVSGASETRRPEVNIVAHTYDFDPETANGQITSLVDNLQPQLIIGESLGAIHALRVKGIPHLLISPALNAPYFLHFLSYLTFIPGITPLFNRIYRPREGDRQALDFTYGTLNKYRNHLKEALSNSTKSGSPDLFVAYIGSRDHYRRTGVVSVRTWKKYFGNTFHVYKGSHFTEEEHIYRLIIPEIEKLLNINK